VIEPEPQLKPDPGADPDHWHRRAGAASGGDVVIFDLDGVLSDASPRQVHLLGGVPDWDGFFAAGIHDEPLSAGVVLARVIALPIVVITARPAFVHADSIEWLGANRVPFDLVITRPEGDRRSSVEFKAAELEALRAAGYDVVLAIDDDPSNVEMYRAHGVEALYIHSGYYDLGVGS